jgi:hypothetical protein
LQEEINNRTVALAVKASKLTAKGLAKALAAALRLIQKEHQKGLAPQGRQSVKKLMNHRVATNAIPLDGETRLFDRVARKYHVDYSFHKTGPKKYLLLFKTGQADAITACFSEYTKLFMARAKDRRPPIREQLRKFEEIIKARPRERERKREAVHDDR